MENNRKYKLWWSILHSKYYSNSENFHFFFLKTKNMFVFFTSFYEYNILKLFFLECIVSEKKNQESWKKWALGRIFFNFHDFFFLRTMHFMKKYLWNLWTNHFVHRTQPRAIQNLPPQEFSKRLRQFYFHNRWTYKTHFFIFQVLRFC